ncbi:MAG: hypothetical protein ACJ71D_11125 [Nitrososphaera sp.]
MPLGFICLTEFSNSSINEGIDRDMLNLIDKRVFVVPSEAMTKEVKDAIESLSLCIRFEALQRFFGVGKCIDQKPIF